MADLVAQSDIETALMRPLTSTETPFTAGLCTQVSAQLRSKRRTVDARITAWQQDPADPLGYDPKVVAGMLADVIARRLLNPRRLWSSGGETAGPFSSPNEVYPGARGGSGTEGFGNLTITAADLAILDGPGGSFVTPGTIRTPPTRWVSG